MRYIDDDGPPFYPWHLGIHLKTGRRCRIPAMREIPQGFVRVLELRGQFRYRYRREHLYPEGVLDARYWSLPRNHDLEWYSRPAIMVMRVYQ